MWDSGKHLKSQRDLAKGVKLVIKEDIKILDYYRYVGLIIFVDMCLSVSLALKVICETEYCVDRPFHVLSKQPMLEDKTKEFQSTENGNLLFCPLNWATALDAAKGL